MNKDKSKKTQNLIDIQGLLFISKYNQTITLSYFHRINKIYKIYNKTFPIFTLLHE